MSRKETPADYETALKNSYDRWEHLREYGGSDPSFADGVNMNLVRNHIMYYKEKIEETLPPYPEIYYRETPPEVDMDYMARPNEIRENAKISLAQFEGNDSLRYLREAVRELTDTQADRLHIPNILGYETALRMAIAEDDLITMRRYENPERYLQSFGSMVSGVILSRHALSFLPISGGRAFARSLHMISAYWGFVFMSLHLGFHWKMMMGIAGKLVKNSSALRKCILRTVAILVAVYGVHAFMKRDIGSYMLLKSHFVFFDFGEPLFWFLLDYITVIWLFVCVGYYVSEFLKNMIKNK